MTVAAASSNPTSGGRGAAPVSGGDAHLTPPQRVVGGDACPLCGTPLRPEQDWCLRCGAAARTRLAATPNWKTPIATIAVVAALALGVLAAALVKLAGGSSSSSAPSTTTVTTPAANAPATPTATPPGASTPTPTASTTAPSTTAGSSTTTGGASAPVRPTSTNGAGAKGAGGAAANPGGTALKLTPAEREALRKFRLGGAAK